MMISRNKEELLRHIDLLETQVTGGEANFTERGIWELFFEIKAVIDEFSEEDVNEKILKIDSWYSKMQEIEKQVEKMSEEQLKHLNEQFEKLISGIRKCTESEETEC